ncbi:unnamed protein product [Leuciscus chuanchicus]
MTCWKCDRACARPEGWNAVIRPGENKLSAAAPMSVARPAKQSKLFNNWYALWNVTVIETPQLAPVLSRGKPPDSAESRRPQQQPDQEPLDGKKRYTDTEKAPGEGRLATIVATRIFFGTEKRRTDNASVLSR